MCFIEKEIVICYSENFIFQKYHVFLDPYMHRSILIEMIFKCDIKQHVNIVSDSFTAAKFTYKIATLLK